MATQIYVNMPVKNLEKSKTFFKALGFNFNPQFTNDQGACMVVSENIYVMLLVESFFKTFTPNPICDAKKSTEMLVCLSSDSREAVDALVGKAVTAGAATPNKPQDSGYMYGHGFQDLDGHLWELVYMNVETHAAQASA